MKISIRNAFIDVLFSFIVGFLVITPSLIVVLVIAALFKYVFGHG